MFDHKFDPYQQLQDLEQRIAGLEITMRKIVNQISSHSRHLEQFGEQGQHIAMALQGLHNQTQLLNGRISTLETLEDIK